MDKKIIFTDLDYTLLKSDRTVSEHTINVLNQCQKKGNLIAFSTSRGFPGVKEYINLIHPDIVICNAGACIYHNDKLIHIEEFSLEELRTLFAKTYELFGEQAEITVDTIENLYWNRKENKTTQYMPDSIYDDLKDFKKSAMKFCVQTEDEEKSKLLASTISNCSYLKFSDIPWYKFSPTSATKENAIKIVTELFKIPFSNTIAFGDDFSDIGMLQICGKGIAVENAIPQVKEIATDFTDSCDYDGVANWIERNL